MPSLKAKWSWPRAPGESRQDLLKDFAQLKKELGKIGRHLALLAIDVADSTGMKSGEDPTLVEHDFLAHQDLVDESIPLEKSSDRVIDAAGHLQKYATPNTIWISEEALEVVANRRGFGPAPRTVDGLDVCEWSKPPASDV